MDPGFLSQSDLHQRRMEVDDLFDNISGDLPVGLLSCQHIFVFQNEGNRKIDLETACAYEL